MYEHAAQEEESKIQQLWQMYSYLKQSESQIKGIVQKLQQIGSQLGVSSPQRGIKSHRSSFQHENSERTISNLNFQIQVLRQQMNNYSARKTQNQKIEDNEKSKALLAYKQQIKQKINKCEQKLHQSINQVKMQTSNSRIVKNQKLEQKIIKNQAFKTIKNKVDEYQKVLGMLWCKKKDIVDRQLKERIRQRYQKVLNLQGTKTKKNMQDVLIDCQKKETINEINKQIQTNSNYITFEANNLKRQIEQIQKSYSSNPEDSHKNYTIAFKRLQKLRSRIEGASEKILTDLQKVQQVLILSKHRTYSIQHKDGDLVESFNKFEEARQKWLDLQNTLLFDFGQY